MRYLYTTGNLDCSRLARNLGAVVVTRFDGEKFTGKEKQKHKFTVGDTVVYFGKTWKKCYGAPVLGNETEKPKHLVLFQLAQSACPQPRLGVYTGKLGDRADAWGTHDFVNPPKRDAGRYSVEMYKFDEEYRLHLLGFGTDALIGRKIPLWGDCNKTVRSKSCGWGVDYSIDQKELLKLYQTTAKMGLNALNYQFAAVDVGVTSAGKQLVLKVNPIPDITDEKVADFYGTAFNDWCERQEGKKDEKEDRKKEKYEVPEFVREIQRAARAARRQGAANARAAVDIEQQ